MQLRIGKGVQVAASILVGILPWCAAARQNASTPSLEEQLKAQYMLVKMGPEGSGANVLEPGTVLVIQKEGIFSVPHASTAVCPSRYQDGRVDSPDALCPATVKKNSRSFKVGEKAYPSQIDVDLKQEKISFGIIACDACNGTSPPTSFKSEVIFQFAKGYLEKASVPEVEDTIAEVFALENTSDTQPQAEPPEGRTPNPSVGEASVVPLRTAEEYYERGQGFAEHSNWEQAINDYRQAIRLRRDYADAHLGLGDGLAIKGEWGDAVAEYRETVRLKPNDAKSHDRLGWALEHNGDRASALQEYRKSHELAPDNVAFRMDYESLQRALNE